MVARLPAGIATDALVLASIAVREARRGYTVIRCPEAPNFWFANCLVLDVEPAPGDYETWLGRHAEIFANAPVQRRVVRWERSDRGGLAPYDGPIERDSTTIFTTRRPPSATPGAARIEPFTFERDWRDGARIVIEAAESEHPEQAAFDAWRFSVHRKDAAAGRCRLWGAWDGDDLVAFAGLYASDEWARFITPITKASHRRRGHFRALAHVAIAETLRVHPNAVVVVAAASGTENEALYERLGFRAVGQQHALVAPV
jgi:hypothetical protein